MVRRLKAFKAPAVEAGELLEKVKEVKKGDDGLYAGDLTTEGAKALSDSKDIRRTALQSRVPYYTTLAGAIAATQAIKAMKADILKVAPLQSYMRQPN